MKRLLLTGAAGFLGWNICRLGREAWSIAGLVHSHDFVMDGVETRAVELTRLADVRKVFEEIRPDAVIHAAAASAPNFCETNREASWKINVEASVNIAGLCADRGIPCVFTSTDLVFDGFHAPYREDSPVNPLSAYGEHKATAEREMLRVHPRVAVCRMPLMFGCPGPGLASESFIQPMLRSLREGREIKLFTDEFRTPLSARDAVAGLLMVIGKVEGILHLGGCERVSRFEFGRMLAEIFGFNDAKFTACLQRDVRMAAPRPPDVSLDSAKARAMGFKPGALMEEILALRE